MKVCVASAGRFHGFDLARQMQRLSLLSRLYTGYPKWKVDGLPPDKVASFPWVIAPMMLLNQRGFQGLGGRLSWTAADLFDRWVARYVEPCDVFHFLSSYGMEAQREARRRHGALTICDRGSSHILSQDAILAEEFSRWGIPYRPMDRRIVQRELREYEEADLILVPSTFVYSSFTTNGVPAEKLLRVPYGVDIRLFRPVPKEDDVFRVIYVGAMNLRKGIPYLLQALAPLQLPRFEIWLVGPVEEDARPFLARYEGSFQTFGYIPRDELFKYYSRASVFVIASIEEGLATVQAQAMACGLPVIATDHTGAEDLFSDGVEGFIVPIRNPEAIREKVQYLFEHPDVRDEMGTAALKRVQALGGWDTYGERVAGCYRSALARRDIKALS